MRASARLGGCSIQSGRRGLQLAARQADVLHFLRAAGLDEDCYFARGARASDVPEFSGAFVPHLPGGPPELNPYRDLDAERITLSGRGAWDISKHLGPDLLLPFLEPLALRSFDPSPAPGPQLRPLPPAARQDLVLLAALAPAMTSNVSAAFSSVVGCSDASTSRVATCEASASPAVVAHLWQTADQKGWYTRLAAEPLDDEAPQEQGLSPERPVASRYDFLEVRCGGPWLSGLLAGRLCVGPVVDFRFFFLFFSIIDLRCLEWILYMLQERRLRSVLVVPPVARGLPA